MRCPEAPPASCTPECLAGGGWSQRACHLEGLQTGRKLSEYGVHGGQRDPQIGPGRGPVLTLSLFQPLRPDSGPIRLPWPHVCCGAEPASSLQPGETLLQALWASFRTPGSPAWDFRVTKMGRAEHEPGTSGGRTSVEGELGGKCPGAGFPTESRGLSPRVGSAKWEGRAGRGRLRVRHCWLPRCSGLTGRPPATPSGEPGCSWSFQGVAWPELPLGSLASAPGEHLWTSSNSSNRA